MVFFKSPYPYWLFTCSINHSNQVADIFNYNCVFVHYTLWLYQFLLSIFCSFLIRYTDTWNYAFLKKMTCLSLQEKLFNVQYYFCYEIYFVWYYYIFLLLFKYSCLHFPPPLPQPHPSPSHPLSYAPLALSMCPLCMLFAELSPFLPHYPLPLSSGYCQFVLNFNVSGYILLVCLFCWLGSTYRSDHLVFVFHCLAHFT